MLFNLTKRTFSMEIYNLGIVLNIYLVIMKGKILISN